MVDAAEHDNNNNNGGWGGGGERKNGKLKTKGGGRETDRQTETETDTDRNTEFLQFFLLFFPPHLQGTYPCLRATIRMKLEIGSYIFQTYLPSILIVILSWASFWIDHEAVPARISVGLLTVLTITTQPSGSRAQLPRVPYIKVSKSWCADPRLLRLSWCSVHACFLGVKNEWYSSPFSSSSSLFLSLLLFILFLLTCFFLLLVPTFLLLLLVFLLLLLFLDYVLFLHLIFLLHLFLLLLPIFIKLLLLFLLLLSGPLRAADRSTNIKVSDTTHQGQ